MRQHLLAARAQWWATPDAQTAQAVQAAALRELLAQLEPQCLGLYWPFDGEFNAAAFAREQGLADDMSLALPFASKAPRQMVYRRWHGEAPTIKD
ncbi:5-formyltetrahydrofolate cyclo-ligase, partial [Mitsuaria sp. WAJ17]|nr:5-formyltetrahydrofolate cyclo-ligase [Mitsuaria sp. WAJ17]